MRNALGLILATVVSAGLIAGIWYWTASPHTQLASAPATIAAAPSPRLAANAAAGANTSDVTAAIPGKPTKPAPPSPAPMIAAQPPAPCSNPDALGVSRVVEIDTTG